MKKIILSIMAVITALAIGCKSIPTTDDMEKTSIAIGYATGMVANQTKISDKDRNIIIEIVNKVATCVPQTNQTFEAAWTPIAQEHVNKLIADGKIDSTEGTLIMGTFNVVVKGIDYLFDVRYPKARTYEELVSAAVHGFTTGFLTVFKPANTLSAAKYDYDVDAYEYLKANK